MNPAPSPPASAPFAVVGRYAIFDEIASGGMATVHLGRLLGAAGFSRTVAIKRLHPQFSRDQEFAAMFMDEARLASRINHPNVVQTLDVVPVDKEILLVMEYVHGVPFAHLLGASRRAGQRVPPRIVAAVMAGVLEGLHAAHEAHSETGAPLGVVHRDVSPQNVLVGVEGVPRVIDFGVAKAMGKMHATREGQLKGKLAYMSPEQVRGVAVTRLSDIFSAAIVLWEALTAERLFTGQNPAELILQVLDAPIRSPRSKFSDLPLPLDVVVMKGLSRDPAQRYATAREMAVALERAVGGLAPQREIAQWVEKLAGAELAARAQVVEALERAVAASPSGGESTRIEGLRASAGLDALTRRETSLDRLLDASLESGPRPKAAPVPLPGGVPVLADPFAFDVTMPQKVRSERPPPEVAPPPASAARPAAPKPPSPRDEAALLAKAGVPPLPEPAPPSASPLSLQGAPSSRTESPSGRVHRIPVRSGAHPLADDDDRASLRERLEWPIRLVAAGVILSLADVIVRQADVALPLRLIWLAEVLVVAGVLWAFVRLFLPAKD
jgi:serine/threonine-protein kinase